MSDSRTKHYDPPVPFERLQELIAALESDGPIDRATRNEIKAALDCLYVTQLIEEDEATPGRRRKEWQLVVAYLVHVLRTEYGAKAKAALIAAYPGARSKSDIERLARAYRKHKKNDELRGVSLHPTVVAAAVARLRAGKSDNK